MNTIKTTLAVCSVLYSFLSVAQTHTVQIAVFEKPVPSNFFQGAGIEDNVHFHKDKNSFYRYYLGPFTTIEEAEQVSLTLKDKGFAFSKIVESKEVYKYCAVQQLSQMNAVSKLKVPLKDLLSSVHFDSGSASLKENSLKTLDRIATQLKLYPNISLELSGHTDSKGNPDLNVKLSKKRIISCRNYLVRKGIAIERLTYVACGESQPIAINNQTDGRQSEEGMAYNRRVVLKMMENNVHLVDQNLEKFRLPSRLVFNSDNLPEHAIHVQVKK